MTALASQLQAASHARYAATPLPSPAAPSLSRALVQLSAAVIVAAGSVIALVVLS